MSNRTMNDRTTGATTDQSVILVTATRYLLPLLLLFSIFLLLRGHNLPGGGLCRRAGCGGCDCALRVGDKR